MILDIEFDKAASIKAALAVEFLDSKIRILQLDGKGGHSTGVRVFNEVTLEAGEIQKGIIQNPKVVGAKLLKCLRTAGPKHPTTQYVICLVPQHHTFLTVLDLPAVERAELKEILARKVSDVIPASETEVYWDWHRIDSTPSKTRIQLAAVSQALIDSYIQTLEYAKLIPLLFEPSTSAASRVVFPYDSIALQKKSTEPVVILELRDTLATISLQQAGGTVFSTDISLKSDSVAEKVVVIEQKILSLVSYAKSNLKIKMELDAIKIYVYGDQGPITQLLPLIQERSPHKISLIEATYEPPAVNQFIAKLNDSSIFPLLGAAIRGLENYSEESSLNLVPQKSKDAYKRKELSSLVRDYMMFIALNSTFLVFMLLLVALQIRAKHEELQHRYESAVSLSNSDLASQIEGKVDALNARTLELNNLVNGIYDWEKVLKFLNEVTPKNVVLTSVSIAANQSTTGAKNRWIVNIAGTARERVEIIDFVNNLRKQGGILENVKLPLASLEDEFDSTFVIEAELPFNNL